MGHAITLAYHDLKISLHTYFPMLVNLYENMMENTTLNVQLTRRINKAVFNLF